MDQKQFVSLISRALDAPLRREAWFDLLDDLIDTVGALSGAVVVADPEHEGRIAPFPSRFLREDAHEIMQRFFQREDADDTQAYGAMLQIPSHRLYSELQLFDLGDRSQLPPSTYRDFQRQTFGIQERYGINLNNYVTSSDLLLLHSADARRCTVEGHRGELEMLAPLIAKSLRLYKIFDALRQRFNAMLGAMDRLNLGVVLMMEDASIIETNKAAQRIIAAGDGLALDGARRLYASLPGPALTLRKAVADAGRTAALDGLVADSGFTVERPSGQPAYLMTVGPLVDSLGELERGMGCAIAFVVDPAEATPISIDGLVRIGGLTPAETEVCKLLVNGMQTAEIAAARELSPETIRSQVKSILAKLRCRSRVDLVRLAVMTRLPIEGDEDGDGAAP